MQREVEVTISAEDGSISIDVLCGHGSGCEQATKWINEAFGTVEKVERKRTIPLKPQKAKIRQKKGGGG